LSLLNSSFLGSKTPILIHPVTIQTAAPIVDDDGVMRDPGAVATGYYVLEDGVLTMTDSAGVPVTDEGGRRFTAPVGEGDNPQVIAGRLTKQVRSKLGIEKDAFWRWRPSAWARRDLY
jgi:hypothetical protein